MVVPAPPEPAPKPPAFAYEKTSPVRLRRQGRPLPEKRPALRLPSPPARLQSWKTGGSFATAHARVGWVLARMVDLDVPLDVAQYAEGQRIVAFFTLNEVQERTTEKSRKSRNT